MKRGRVEIHLELFDHLARWAHQHLEKEAERLAQFLGAEIELRVVRSQC